MKQVTGLGAILRGLNGDEVLDGEPPALGVLDERQPVAIGRVIANVLAGSSTREPARAMSIAVKLYDAPDSMELEDADYTLVLETMQNAQLANFSKAAALAVLEAAESDSAEKAAPEGSAP